MPIEYVPVLDEDGNDVAGYTESVPETYAKEEPDCNDTGCTECGRSTAPPTRAQNTWTAYSTEPPW